MVEYLELFKGDDTDFSLNQAICIKLVTDYDLAGCTAHVKFYDYEQTFYPIVDKKLPLSFPSSATSKFPLGRGTAKIWLTEPDPEGAGTRRRTVANDLKILVTNNIDILSRKDISYTMLLRYDYNDLGSKPMLNGKVIEGDHTDDYYGIKSANPDTKLSEESENAVQNKVIAVKFKETDETVARIDEDIAKASAAADEAQSTADTAQTTANEAKGAADLAVKTAEENALSKLAESNLIVIRELNEETATSKQKEVSYAVNVDVLHDLADLKIEDADFNEVFQKIVGSIPQDIKFAHVNRFAELSFGYRWADGGGEVMSAMFSARIRGDISVSYDGVNVSLQEASTGCSYTKTDGIKNFSGWAFGGNGVGYKNENSIGYYSYNCSILGDGTKNETLIKLAEVVLADPSTEASASGKAADAKAVGEALNGKVDNKNGVIKSSLAVGELENQTIIEPGSINQAFLEDPLLGGIALETIKLPKKSGTFALISDIADAVKDKANQNDLDALAAKVDNANATLEEIA